MPQLSGWRSPVNCCDLEQLALKQQSGSRRRPSTVRPQKGNCMPTAGHVERTGLAALKISDCSFILDESWRVRCIARFSPPGAARSRP
jgi:hypothetical protein